MILPLYYTTKKTVLRYYHYTLSIIEKRKVYRIGQCPIL
nr:MAG TPA: hypothetical protein [Caudoviricetes sp.]